MRILDTILAGKSATAASISPAALADFKRDIRGMESLDIDNVAELFYADMDRSWDIGRELPCLAPPFPDFWMEYARPARCPGNYPLPHRAAIRFWNDEPTAEYKKARWALACQTFLQPERHASPLGPIGTTVLFLDDRGAFSSYACKLHREAMPDMIEDDEKAEILVLGLSSPALLAISFLHCKNVTVQREQPPDPRLAKRQRERGLPPRVVFKTLNITPMKTILEKTMTETSSGLKRALHICRGHFADYGEHGLFGKIQGRFWIPQHLRGALDKGIVHKTYSVKAPAK